MDTVRSWAMSGRMAGRESEQFEATAHKSARSKTLASRRKYDRNRSSIGMDRYDHGHSDLDDTNKHIHSEPQVCTKSLPIKNRGRVNNPTAGQSPASPPLATEASSKKQAEGVARLLPERIATLLPKT